MGLLTSLLLGALGVGVAAANTNDYADSQAHTPLYHDLSAEAERVAEVRRLQAEAERKLVRRPHWDLGVRDWVRLCIELGYWENPNEPVERFWERVAIWDAQHEDPSGSSAAHPQSASPSSLLVPGSETLPPLLCEEDGRATGPGR